MDVFELTWFKIILLLISSLDSLSAEGTCHSAAQDLPYLDWINSGLANGRSLCPAHVDVCCSREKPFNNGICKTTKMLRSQENLIILYMIVFHWAITALRREQQYQPNNSALVNPLRYLHSSCAIVGG